AVEGRDEADDPAAVDDEQAVDALAYHEPRRLLDTEGGVDGQARARHGVGGHATLRPRRGLARAQGAGGAVPPAGHRGTSLRARAAAFGVEEVALADRAERPALIVDDWRARDVVQGEDARDRVQRGIAGDGHYVANHGITNAHARMWSNRRAGRAWRLLDAMPWTGSES